MGDITPTISLPVKFKQTTVSGCMSLSLANIFNDHRFLIGIEDMKKGERAVDANKKLALYQPFCYLETLFTTHHLCQYPRFTDPWMLEFVKVKGEEIDETFARPLMISFRRENGIHHCVAILHNLKNDLYYVVDSKEDFVRRLTAGQLIGKYHITTVEYFGLWDHPDPANSMYLRKEYLNHIIPEGE